ncbi:MAG: nitroreductase [Proteobacteria bacterium]|nr:nitroreductase [Pseudomonadota bacterium]MDA1135549.1 nitroreductase [Pseudomonadota bacterium]
MKNIIKFLQIRRSITAKNMIDNNINEDDLEAILDCGIRVPDHGALNPWKLIVIKNNARFRIGNDILAKEFKVNNPTATEEEIDYERKRFCRANVIIAVLFKPVSHPKIPLWEMELSSGAVCTTLLIAAQSLGYAAQWLTEWYAYSKAMIIELGGNPDTDKVAGFIYIGNKEKDPIERRRPKKENVIDFLIK